MKSPCLRAVSLCTRSLSADGDCIAGSDVPESATTQAFFCGVGQQFAEIATGKFQGEAALVNGWEAQTAQAQANWGQDEHRATRQSTRAVVELRLGRCWAGECGGGAM